MKKRKYLIPVFPLTTSEDQIEINNSFENYISNEVLSPFTYRDLASGPNVHYLPKPNGDPYEIKSNKWKTKVEIGKIKEGKLELTVKTKRVIKRKWEKQLNLVLQDLIEFSKGKAA